jgi:hypothetical protein
LGSGKIIPAESIRQPSGSTPPACLRRSIVFTPPKEKLNFLLAPFQNKNKTFSLGGKMS